MFKDIFQRVQKYENVGCNSFEILMRRRYNANEVTTTPIASFTSSDTCHKVFNNGPGKFF